MTFYRYPDYMYHHGVKGMKWGVRKKYIKHPRDFKYNNEYSQKNPSKIKKKELTPEEKKARNKKYIKRGALVVGALVLVYGAYKLSTLSSSSSSATIDEAVNRLEGMKKDGLLGEAKIHTDKYSGNYYNTNHLYDHEWYKGLSGSEKNAITAYTGNSYHPMNLFLRNRKEYQLMYPKGLGLDNHVDTSIKNLTSALNKTSTKEDIVVHRGVGDALKKMLGHDNISDSAMKTKEYREALKGMTFTEKGFFSSGGSTKDAWGGVKLHAYVPKGSKAAYVNPISSHMGENEFVLQRNSTFKINDVISKADGTITDVIIELIEQKL